MYGRDVGHRIPRLAGLAQGQWSRPKFQAIKNVIVWFLIALEDMMLWFTMARTDPATVALSSWLLVSFRMALFAAASLLLLATFGLCGIDVSRRWLLIIVTCHALDSDRGDRWAFGPHRANWLDAVLRPILDAMQTMPSFVYLVPAIAFFYSGLTRLARAGSR